MKRLIARCLITIISFRRIDISWNGADHTLHFVSKNVNLCFEYKLYNCFLNFARTFYYFYHRWLELLELSLHKFLYVAKLVYNDLMKFSRKFPCPKTSLIRFTFIKLPIRCILNLAVILRRKLLQVSLRRRSNFESSSDLHQFYRDFNANKLKSYYKFQSSVIFSVLID